MFLTADVKFVMSTIIAVGLTQVC